MLSLMALDEVMGEACDVTVCKRSGVFLDM
jgi:hypothetical protein